MKKDYRELYEKITNSDWFKKAYHNKSLGECPIVVEELEESEDERIRKSLIKDFRNYYEMYDKSCGEPKWGSDSLVVKDILDWLERRKEQKPLSTEETELNSIAFLEQMGYTCIPLGKELKPDTRDADDLQLLGFIYDLLNEIKWKDSYAMSKEECLRRLNDYRPQKPAEWSEEDSRILYNVIAYVGYAAGQRGVRDDEFKEANSWLKSLPKGFIVNPNYNEDMVNLLVGELQSIAERNGAPRQYDAEITWLKSLRPQFHWKPSDEQKSVAEQFAKIVRGNLIRIDKEVQQKFEQLYFEVTGNKMYGGYND